MIIVKLEHQNKLAQANASVNAAIEQMTYDPHRLSYHVSPPVYWLNDPNGLIYFQGHYHLFYQHNPYGPKWGNIHWAHMRSKDLIHWEHLPIALAPSEKYDRDGCFSGSAVERDGKLYLFYTGNIYTSNQGLPDDLFQQQCAAVSEDGIHFEKLDCNPLISTPPREVGDFNHFRDPKVFRQDGLWYMVVGNMKDYDGHVLLYRSEDLLHWQYVGMTVQSNGKMGYMHECPDYFVLNGQEVLLLSPKGIGPEDQPSLSGYYTGSMNWETGKFEHGDFHLLDDGFDFFAPQTFEDDKGRRILFGWMRMPVTMDKEWAGSMTVPRELKSGGDGRLTIHPVDELKLLREAHTAYRDTVVENGVGKTLPHVRGSSAELIVVFDLQRTDAEEFGVKVRVSADGKEETAITYVRGEKRLTLDRNRSGAGVKGIRSSKCLEGDEELTLQLFIDHSLVEVFVNNGETVISGFVFPDPDSNGISLFANKGQAVVKSVDFWILGTSVDRKG